MRPKPELKPLFIERMKDLLAGDLDSYLEILEKPPVNSIRCNTLKISPEELVKRLKEKGWQISQPFKGHEEIMIVENDLLPGELGRSMEHLLGYYYVQEIASMLPALALKPEAEDLILDLCSSPGSKTTQIAAQMENKGTIIANEINLKRIKILASNLERCGATNVIITRKEGVALCRRLKDLGLEFDKILVDAPCSGEGTIRSTPKTAMMWNPNTIRTMSKIQKGLVEAAWEILKPEGELVYSTCTHAPEENEEIVDFMLNEFDDIKIEKITLPINCKHGLKGWGGREYKVEVEKSCRIYPQDNNTEGFFIAKFRKTK